MKSCVPAIIFLIAASVILAGCTGTPSAPPAATTPIPTSVPASTTVITEQQPAFVLQSYYVNANFSFQDPKEVQTREFRIPGDSTTGRQPWGIEFHVKPLTDNPQNCWFDMKVTNVDTGQSSSYGYGAPPMSAGGNKSSYGYDLDQYIPMYNSGPYKIEMSGDTVSVRLIVGNRNP